MKFRVNNYVVSIPYFSSSNSGEVSLAGDAVYLNQQNGGSLKREVAGTGTGSRVSLCSRVEVDSDEAFQRVWMSTLCSPMRSLSLVDAVVEDDYSGGGKMKSSGIQYSVGALWLTDQKYVVKGFTFSATFLCDWMSIQGHLMTTLKHGPPKEGGTPRRVATSSKDDSEHESRSTLIGTVSLCLHGDRKGVHTSLSHRSGDATQGIPDSFSVGVSFYGE